MRQRNKVPRSEPSAERFRPTITSFIARSRKGGNLGEAFTSSAFRAVTLPFAGIASILSARLVVESSGSIGFAFFSIITSLPALIPVSDFGISAVVTDNIARHGIKSWQFKSVWLRTQRLLWTIAGALSALGIAVGVGGLWAQILGVTDSTMVDVAATAVVILMAIGIPLGAGQRVLLGVGRQTLATGLISSSPILSFGLTAAVYLLWQEADFPLLAIAYSLGSLITQLIVMLVALSHIRRHARKPIASPTSARIPIRHTALPMAVIAITLPLAYQSDRILLAHVSSNLAVTNYALVAILYFPLLSIIAFGQQPLWPLFLRHSTQPRQLIALYRNALWAFLSLGVVLGCALAVIGPKISNFVDSSTRAPLGLYLAFAALLIMFGLNSASGMLLMDTAGRRLQAAGSVAMLASKLALTLTWAPAWGAEGAVWATVISASLFMVLPSFVVAVHRLNRMQKKDGAYLDES